MEPLKIIIRDAQNKVKNLEWSDNRDIAYEATKIWNELEVINQRLGPFKLVKAK